MIQILALRDVQKSNGQMSKAEVWFERGLRAANLEEILANPLSFLAKVEESERFNIYFTEADCVEERGRKLVEQFHIPFDVDKLDLPPGEVASAHLETYAIVICKALGLDPRTVGTVFSGNGLQFHVGIQEPIDDVDYFGEHRVHYKAACDRINAALRKANLPGEADPSVWSPARLMRMPGTRNIKPNKPTRLSRVIQPHIERLATNITRLSGLPELGSEDTIAKSVADTFPTPDVKEIMGERGCGFMRFAQIHPDKISEPQWYAALSISARFPNGREFSHKLSEGHPSYDYHEADRKIQQAKESSGPRTCTSINQLWDGCRSCPHWGKVLSPIVIEGPDHIKTAHTGFHTVSFSKDGTPKIGKPHHDDLVKHFRNTHPFKSVEGKIWIYDGSAYSGADVQDLHKFANDNFEPTVNKNMRDEFISRLQYNDKEKPDWFFQSTEGRINFKNAILSIRDGSLGPHSPEAGFTSTVPFDYDVAAAAPRWEKFLQEVMLGRQDLIDLLQEYVGYALGNMPSDTHEKALILFGDGSNGKSTFVKVLRQLFGEQATSNVSARNLSNDQILKLTEGKLINIAEENSADSFKNSELLKNFISGGKISIKEVYTKPYEISATAKLVMLCNRLPSTFDTTHGMLRKFFIVPFDATFTDETKDINLYRNLLEELPGIANWAIEGYKRLKRQGNFSKSETVDKAMQRFTQSNDSVLMWMTESVEFTEDDAIQCNRQELYDDYRDFCRSNGIREQSARAVYEGIRARGKKILKKEVQEHRPKLGKDRVYTMSNVIHLTKLKH